MTLAPSFSALTFSALVGKLLTYLRVSVGEWLTVGLFVHVAFWFHLACWFSELHSSAYTFQAYTFLFGLKRKTSG